MAKLSKARQRGLWPEPAPVGYVSGPRVEVAISMDRGAYDWLAGFVHDTGYVWCVEDALNKAVSAIQGDEPMAFFADGIAWQHGIRSSELVFRAGEPADKTAVDRLYTAALFIAALSRSNTFAFVRDDILPPPAVLALAQAALGDSRDLQGEIERARKELEALDAETRTESEAEIRKMRTGSADFAENTSGAAGARNDLDDDIPF